MSKYDRAQDYSQRNREKAQLTKRGKFWCKCDLSLVSQSKSKCKVCGRRNSNRKKIK